MKRSPKARIAIPRQALLFTAKGVTSQMSAIVIAAVIMQLEMPSGKISIASFLLVPRGLPRIVEETSGQGKGQIGSTLRFAMGLS